MFEAVELGRKVDRETWDRVTPGLRVDLLNAQFELRSADFPVLIVLSGDDRLGVDDTVNLLHEWLDVRYIETFGLGAPTDEERERPEFWRYWRTLPWQGRTAVYVGGWTLRAIRDRMGRRIKKVEFERALERIRRFERALADDGALVLKFWLHLPKDQHARRVRQSRRDPEKAWRVDDVDRRLLRDYDEAMRVVEHALRRTSTVEAPWIVVESTDRRHRALEIGRRVLESIQRRLHGTGEFRRADVAPDLTSHAESAGAERLVLDTVDLAAVVGREEYEGRFERAQAAVHRLSAEAVDRGVSSIVVLEGWDAAGKGGAIRRISAALDARHYRVIPVSSPTEEELAHHYLWRFWMPLPRAGHIVLFDRSWYGRVLVERVEGYAREGQWRRAYEEINEFEEQLVEHGIVLLKLWLHISREEQAARFEAREKTPYKKYKMTDEDYRNRDRWRAYEQAVHDMVARTSTEIAPWKLIAANDKRHARVTAMESLRDALEQRLR